MDTAAAPAPRPLSQQRPTQAYYVPRKLLECGRVPTPQTKEAGKASPENAKKTVPRKSPSGDRSQSPKETNNNEKKENVKPKKSSSNGQQQKSPRPLMAEIVPKPDSLKVKKNQQRPRTGPQVAESPAPLIQKVKGLTMSEPRVVSPRNGAVSLSLQNRFSPKQEGPDDVCICSRPETHIICRRCGYECVGRAVKVCQQHPMKLSLMDIRECPNPICRSIQILEVSSPDSDISQPF